MFKIGDFSKLTNLTVRTLHHYEDLGLLLPHHINPDNNYRYYGATQLETVNQIKMLQEVGLPLKTIKEIIEVNDIELLEHYYKLREEEIKSELDELKIKMSTINAYLLKMKEDNIIDKYNVEIKTVPARKVMSLRRILANYEDEGILWNDLYHQSLKQKVTLTTPPTGMTIFHDKEYVEHDADVEIQSTIIGDYEDQDGITYYDAEAFTLASVTFNGSFEQMPEVTKTIATWIERNNYKIVGPMVNISHVSPAQDDNPDNWVSESGFVVSK